jgi:hypothetical protein
MRKTEMGSFLSKALILPFYRKNAGFFLVVLLVGFGMFRIQDHVYLMRLCLESPVVFFAVAGSLWALYSMKTAAYIEKALGLPEMEFLYQLRLFPPRTLLFSGLQVQLSLQLPVLAYGIWMCRTALTYRLFSGLGLTMATLFVFLAGPLVLYNYWLQHPNPSGRKPWPRVDFWRKSTKPSLLFFPLALWESEKATFFMVKPASALLTVLVCRLYQTDAYDPRLLSIGVLLVGMIQSSIGPVFHRFEQEQFSFFRNLPWTLPIRFLWFYGVYLLVLLPEGLLLVTNLPNGVSFSYLLSAVLFLSALSIASHCLLYVRPSDPEGNPKLYFAAFFFSALCIMFQIPAWVLALGWLCVAYGLFLGWYQKVEYPNGF